MYSIPPFSQQDRAVNLDFIRKHPFTMLLGAATDGKPVATQVPLLLKEMDGQWILVGHFMKNTDHTKAFIQNPKALAVFHGVEGYISSSWYQQPASAGTWNYCSVQVSGQLVFLDREGTRQCLEYLTNYFETEDSPGHFSKIPADYIDTHLDHICGFHIKAEEIKGTFKLSQNKTTEEQFRIITELRNRNHNGDAALADSMEQHLKMKR